MLQALLLLLLAEVSWLGPDGAALPFRTPEEAVSFLREAKVLKVVKRNLGGTTLARKLLIEKDGVQAHAVVRSHDRVYYNAKWDDGRQTKFLRDSYRNELAAYELSILLGLDTVPPTASWGKGALQLWIENTRPGFNPAKGSHPPDTEAWAKARAKMRVFDALIENVDRNVGNMLIDAAGRVWWIDHTRSFGRGHDLEQTELIQRCHRGLYEHLKAADPKVIADRMGAFMSPREIEALLERRLKLIALIERRLAERGAATALFD